MVEDKQWEAIQEAQRAFIAAITELPEKVWPDFVAHFVDDLQVEARGDIISKSIKALRGLQ